VFDELSGDGLTRKISSRGCPELAKSLDERVPFITKNHRMEDKENPLPFLSQGMKPNAILILSKPLGINPPWL
jgi:hypothetical protein